MQKHHPRRILFLVDQPWQAAFASQIIKYLKDASPEIQVKLAFTDYFTFYLRHDFLTGLTTGIAAEVSTLHDLYKSWQIENENPEVDYIFLDMWDSKYCKIRSLVELERTNQWIFGDERKYFHRKISKVWEKRILHDTILWCEDLVDTFKPTEILAIERSTLPTNLILTYSQSKSIPFRTFIPSRVGNRWIYRDDFGYGVSEELHSLIVSQYSNGQNIQNAKEEIAKIIEKAQGSYQALEHKISNNFEHLKTDRYTFFRKELRLWLGRVYGRVFIQPKERAFRAVRLNENFVNLSLYEIKRISYFLLRSFRTKLVGSVSIPTAPYFLWALHMRPEGSVLVLGDGKDEIKELLETADKVPDGYLLAVKENPEMFGTRKRGFYKKLKKHSKIILIDPFVPTFQLINKSEGVIGISGTVLLEAALLDKPSCSLGHPEFDDYLVARGWDSADEFFTKCLLGEYESPYQKILPYVSYVVATSSPSDINFEGDLNSQSATITVNRFTRLILGKANPSE